MCGFLGEASRDLISKESFLQLLNLSIKRGPDQQGYWNDKNCQLGFNRLSIIDLSENGKQPLSSPSGKFIIIFNGEIYNYKEIQKKYNIADEDLRSSSDSEILAHLIERVTLEEFANELNGMFAISIYDIQNSLVHLIRDFAGIKPLFYGIHNHGIIFGSQFDQIFCHPQFSNKELRPEIMKEYFGLGYMQPPNTIFKNIFQVEPSQIVTWSIEQAKIESKTKYFSWNVTPKLDETSKEVVEQFESVFSKVIKNQLHADVPVATFFSGGIDSPLVAALCKQHNNDIQAYTIGVDDENHNESEAAQKMAAQIKIKQVIETIDETEILNCLELHFKGLCEPFGDYSSLPTYLITKKAKEFATVMLSGDGGDELFWGYPRFLKSLEHLYWFKWPLFLRKIAAPIFRKFKRNISVGVELFDNFEDWIIYKQTHFTKLDKLMSSTRFSAEMYEVYKFKGPANKQNALLYLKKNEFDAHMQRTLRKVDLMSMANSLEVRVPFLDKEVIEFSNTIIPKYGITHTTAKLVLRKLLNKFVSKELIDLPKKGFSIPIDVWLKNELKEDVIHCILNKPFYGSEFIDQGVLKEIVSDFYNDKFVDYWGIWHLYSWQKWAANYGLV